MCASSLSKRRCTDGQPTETSCRAHPAAGTPTWPLNGGQLRPARSVPASLGRWALQVEILPHGSGLTMDTATDRSRGRGGLDRIESDGGGGSGLMPPGRKNLSNSARPRHVLCEHTPPRRSLGFGAAAIASSLASGTPGTRTPARMGAHVCQCMRQCTALCVRAQEGVCVHDCAYCAC